MAFFALQMSILFVFNRENVLNRVDFSRSILAKMKATIRNSVRKHRLVNKFALEAPWNCALRNHVNLKFLYCCKNRFKNRHSILEHTRLTYIHRCLTSCSIDSILLLYENRVLFPANCVVMSLLNCWPHVQLKMKLITW